MQALVDSGELEQATVVVARTPVTAGSAEFVIGIASSSSAAVYGDFQRRGGVTPKGGVVPDREFLGVGRGDIDAAEGFAMAMLLKRLQR